MLVLRERGVGKEIVGVECARRECAGWTDGMKLIGFQY